MAIVVWLVAGFLGDFFLGACDSEFDYGNLPKGFTEVAYLCHYYAKLCIENKKTHMIHIS